MVNTCFLWTKIQIYFGVFMTKITWSDICVLPLQHRQIWHDFDSFSDFPGKLETSFCTLFLNFVPHNGIFLQFFPGGATYIFSLEPPPLAPKRHLNSNSLNIYLIGKWEYETWFKIKRLRRWQNFWISTNFDTFWSKKSSL